MAKTTVAAQNNTVKVITANGIETRRIFEVRKIPGGRTGRVSLGGKMVRVWKLGRAKRYTTNPPCHNLA